MVPFNTPGKFRCEIVSWARVVKDARRLSWSIQDSGYSSDIVVAIGRGGYVPARILCDYLSIGALTAIKVEHWRKAGSKRQRAVVKFPLNAKIVGKRVLLVDDLTDTGETLSLTLRYLRRFHPKEIRTAVLLHKTCSEIVPDFFVTRSATWRWVIFPWHWWEDLTGFITELRAAGITRDVALSRELHVRHNIAVKPDVIREVLSRMK